MSNDYKITLPKLGESIVSATIVKWHKNVGDMVNKDESILEVTTDKVNSEIPSPVKGKLKEIIALPDEEVHVGDTLAIISLDVESDDKVKSFFSPAVLELAKEKGVSLSDLENIKGTGEEGRVTKRDIENFKQENIPHKEEREILKMSAMRKIIADNMIKSNKEIPSAALLDEIDVTKLMDIINSEKDNFFNTHKVKLTITSFVVLALEKALKAFPLVNATYQQDQIVVNNNINIGIAVSVKDAITVPVIKNVENMSKVSQVAIKLTEMANKAREGTLSYDDIKDGTITVTNFGMTGVLGGIPIIRYPEAAILGIGAIKKKAVVLNDGTIAARNIMMVSLSFDHRMFDGIYGCGFLAEFKKNLENVDKNSL